MSEKDPSTERSTDLAATGPAATQPATTGSGNGLSGKAKSVPETAMVMAAGLGKRMRPLTRACPKPLIPVAGRPLIAYTLDRFAQAGVKRAVVNVHYLADQLEAYLSGYDRLTIAISDERDAVLETGGGLLKAAPLLGSEPFFCANTDAILIDGPGGDPCTRLAAGFDDGAMDALLLLVRKEDATGIDGAGDFSCDRDGRLGWRTGQAAPYYFTGMQILSPRLLTGDPGEAFSTRRFWEAAMDNGRLFGLIHDGTWMHVGDVAGLEDAEKYFTNAPPHHEEATPSDGQ